MDKWMLTPKEITTLRRQWEQGESFTGVDLATFISKQQADKMIREGFKTDEQWTVKVRDLVLRGRMDYLGLTENEQQFLMDIGREIWILDVVRSEAREEALREVVKMFDEARRMRREWIGDREGPNYDRHTDYAVIEQLRIKSGRMPEGK